MKNRIQQEIKKKNYAKADDLQLIYNNKLNEVKYRINQEYEEMLELKENQLKKQCHQFKNEIPS